MASLGTMDRLLCAACRMNEIIFKAREDEADSEGPPPALRSRGSHAA